MSTTMSTTTARLYVGTYAKYNNGSIAGAWLDLSDYADAAEFYAACKELHSDEADPEFMFQDYEGFPETFYSESMSEADAEKLFEYVNMGDDDRKMLDMYAEATGYSRDEITLEAANDAFMGTANSGADFAQQQAEDCGEIPKDMPTWIVIDWEASWECNLRHDYNYTRDDEGTMYFFLNH